MMLRFCQAPRSMFEKLQKYKIALENVREWYLENNDAQTWYKHTFGAHD